MGTMVSLTGQKFGRLLVLQQSTFKSADGKLWWDCVCDCGNFVRSKGIRLTQGSKIKSCGCYTKDRMRELAAIESARKIGVPSPKRLANGLGSRNAMFCSYKNGAIRRGLEFDITREEFIEITQRDCFYCGIKPQQVKWNHYHSAFIYNGIDRVDNRYGYVKDNLVTCCKYCNRAKHTMSMSEFMSWLERISVRKQQIKEFFNSKGGTRA